MVRPWRSAPPATTVFVSFLGRHPIPAIVRGELKVLPVE